MPSTPTIGIVTAIPEEFAAVEAVIDNHAREFIDDDERSTYIAGTMPSARPGLPHPVVVTLMTRAGNDIAATSTTNLMRSYPTVGLIVMCGIAAGIPSSDPRTHVALGDIVVATRGIVDYDHVTVTDDGVRLREGIPRPSPLLTNAANLLIAGQHAGRRPWEAWLDPAARGLPPEYLRPTENGRPSRPTVHYGHIGSADRSLRSAAFRDALAAQHDLRAVEMEGKGIGNGAFLNGLEWFVVRGVSDHADDRREHAWRLPAALAAAAYMRALLGECGPVAPRRPPAPKTAATPGGQAGSTNVTGIAHFGPSFHEGDVYIGGGSGD
jgi:nucleoside phosphorylase